MKNSHLLLLAVAFCLLNALSALWASFSASALKSRLQTAEQEVKTLADRLQSGSDKIKDQLQDESERIKRLEDRVFVPPSVPGSSEPPRPAKPAER